MGIPKLKALDDPEHNALTSYLASVLQSKFRGYALSKKEGQQRDSGRREEQPGGARVSGRMSSRSRTCPLGAEGAYIYLRSCVRVLFARGSSACMRADRCVGRERGRA